ncbi:uncharacterized protein LOC110675143 [Aedes aegypti]|uniref:Uncharacterized protein n=1 Tax=Aedes aegypti TaxID=7159 RepID=A0A6I8TQ62_AEDAE|nr:uncharacterized protein LOC110675143 [Aedes aegypti]
MAPQNSTLIHGNAEATSVVSAEVEELSSYSPILPSARASHRRRASPAGSSSSSVDGPPPPPPPPPNVTKSIASFGPYGGFRSEVLASTSRGGKTGIHREGTEKGAVKRDSRNPVTYYRDSANDTDEDEMPMAELGSIHADDEGTSEDEIEIPIWIRGEPRFVAGINDTTTCNNIIQALIDDELQNGNYKHDVNVSL